MANKGKDTNGSQFFITFSKLPHLDGKHTVFGKLVKGFPILDVIERVGVDEKNKPKEELKINTVLLLNNPYRSTISEILKKDWALLHKEYINKIEVEKYENTMKRQKVA